MIKVSDLWKQKQMQKETARPAPEPPPPAPTDEAPRRNGVFINDKEKCLQVMIFQNGDDSLPMALGSLELAKDVIKQKMTEWNIRQRQIQPKILVPGNGKLH
jgi:hypothetical protein